ncbi:MAG: hypothetical protein JWP81_543 [Ferruginibacter sp.]|nr:hypothetical protein [Ferruginibacter sp.]
MIKIFLLNYIFQFRDRFSWEYLKSKEIVFTNSPLSADIIISTSSLPNKYKIARKIFFFKKFMVSTIEPRHDLECKKFRTKKQIIMNIYSGDAFLHNLHFLGSYYNGFARNLGIDLASPPGRPLTTATLAEKKKFCLAAFAYRDPEKSKLIINGKNVDLFAHRQDLARFFNKRNKCDIIGHNWPADVKILESSGSAGGYDNWWDRKLELLGGYRFNICFENTAHPYYCTEKIWHAIAAGCLPVYYGEGTAIYETFPENSFIDASKFETNGELLYFMENLSHETHIERYNKCLTVMHQSCIQRLLNPQLRTAEIDKFVDNIYLLAGK